MLFYEDIRDTIYSLFVSSHAQEGWKQRLAKGVAMVLSGGISGSIGVILGNPVDVVKVRMMSSGYGNLSYAYQHSFQGVVEIVKHEGFFSLYKGLTPNIQRSFMSAAVEMGSYDIIKSTLLSLRLFQDPASPMYVILSSIITGFNCTLFLTPLDVCKIRLMSTSSEKGHEQGIKYRGMVHVLTDLLKTEGIRGLYKGFLPSFMRLGSWSVIFFLMFEQYRKVMHKAMAT